MKAQRRNWSKDDIEFELMSMVNFLGINRMPTYKEMELHYGNCGLANKVCRTGGIYEWANRLGLEVGASDTRLGYEVETLVMDILNKQGYECEMTSTRHPYDLLVNGCVKIDVKAARMSKANGSDCYSFSLAKPMQTCDVYVAVCLDDEKVPQKIYVIPAHVMHGKTQLSLGIKRSKYDQYIDKWEIIDQLLKAFEGILTDD